jgi:hypothetical protein
MRLLELEQSLPNGLHDSHIHTISADYIKREIDITLDVHWGTHEGKNEFERYAYRTCLLKLTGLEYFVVDPPDSGYAYAKSETLWIDAGPLESAKLKSKVAQVQSEWVILGPF